MRDRLVSGVEIAEHPRAGAETLFARQFEREMVDMRRYPSHRRAAAPRDEQLVRGVAEERVLGRVDQFELFGAQLRHRMWLARGKGAADVDEFGPSRLALDRFDHHIPVRHSRTLSFSLD